MKKIWGLQLKKSFYNVSEKHKYIIKKNKNVKIKLVKDMWRL